MATTFERNSLHSATWELKRVTGVRGAQYIHSIESKFPQLKLPGSVHRKHVVRSIGDLISHSPYYAGAEIFGGCLVALYNNKNNNTSTSHNAYEHIVHITRKFEVYKFLFCTFAIFWCIFVVVVTCL